MTEAEREELIEKITQNISSACGYRMTPQRKGIVQFYSLIALAVAEPVIREQANDALREENERLRGEKDILQNDLNLAERCWADEHDKRLMDVENEIEECALVVERLNGWGSDYGMGGHAEHFAKIIRLRKRAAIREGENKDE